MKNLKTIEAKVKAILQKNEDARNDDMTLYLIVCNTYLKGAGAMPFAEVISVKLMPLLHSREVFLVKIPRLFLFLEVILLNEK